MVEETVRLLVLVLVLVLLGLAEEDDEEVTPGVVTWLPGRHCEYHWFCATQVDPEAQQVAPCHPLPPHWVLHIMCKSSSFHR